MSGGYASDEVSASVFAAIGMARMGGSIDIPAGSAEIKVGKNLKLREWKKRSCQWRNVVKIIAVIRAEQLRNPWDWAILSYATIAERAECGLSTVRLLLGSKPGQGWMWRVWWMLERGEVGEGGRATAWRVNHASSWRKVPWDEPDKEKRDARLGFSSHDQNEPTEGDEKFDARQGMNPPRVFVGSSQASNKPKVLRQIRLARSFPAWHRALPQPSAARFKGEMNASEPFNEAPTTTSPAGTAVPPSVDEVKPAPTTGVGEEEDDAALWEAAQAAITAIEEKAGAEVNSAKLKAEIRSLVRRIGLDELLDAVEASSDDLGPPLIVSFCERVAAGDTHLLKRRGRAPAPAADPVQVRLAQLEDQLKPYKLSGERPPQWLLATWEECQNATGTEREEPPA